MTAKGSSTDDHVRTRIKKPREPRAAPGEPKKFDSSNNMSTGSSSRLLELPRSCGKEDMLSEPPVTSWSSVSCDLSPGGICTISIAFCIGREEKGGQFTSNLVVHGPRGRQTGRIYMITYRSSPQASIWKKNDKFKTGLVSHPASRRTIDSLCCRFKKMQWMRCLLTLLHIMGSNSCKLIQSKWIARILKMTLSESSGGKLYRTINPA